MGQTAKIFMSGRSQAVRLPMAFRFDTPTVFIRKDPRTGDVVMSRRPDSWDGFLNAIAQAEVPENFLSPEDRMQGEHTRDPFEGLAP